jgi:drug/metabolite transporter (DMT)-like permease
MPLWGFLLSLFVALLWAISPVLIKEGLRTCTPNEVPAIRSISFAVTMSALMLLIQPGKMPFVTPKLLLGLALSVGMSTMLGDLMYVYAIENIGAALAVSVSNGYPVITAVFSILILGESIPALVWCGTILIVVGLLVIKYDASRRERAGQVQTPDYGLIDPDERERRARKLRRGISLAFGSALCSGLNIPINKLLMVEGGWTPTENYFLRSLLFLLMAWGMRLALIRFAPNAIKPLKRAGLSGWAYLTAGGFIGLAVSGVLFAVCIEAFPVSVVTPITASSPFMTVMLARAVLKEKLSPVQSAGVALVIAGSISVSL